MDKFSYIANADVNVIDDLYQKYKTDPDAVDTSWQHFFKGFEFSIESYGENGKHDAASTSVANVISLKELGVRNLIHAYRTRGHLKSDTNPVRPRRKHNVKLELTDFGLTNEDLDVEYEYEVGQTIGLGRAKLRNIFDALKKVYLGPIGFEYMHVRNHEVIEWFKEKAERIFFSFNASDFS